MKPPSESVFRRLSRSLRELHPLAAPALRTATAFVVGLSAVALLAGAVRVLPWLLEPSVPVRVAFPFARSVAELAVEAALLAGFPIGFTLAAQRFAERGEARVYELLGQPPWRGLLRLAPAAAPFVIALASISYAGGRDAEAPGRVAQDLVDQGAVACATSEHEMTRTVPFVGATWLCAPNTPPRLYGRAPVGGAVYSARHLRVSGDMRRVDLEDARVLAGSAELSIGELTLRGLSPYAQSSALPPFLRALLVVLAALASAAAAVHAALVKRIQTALGAVVLGATGPLTALGSLRLLDRLDVGQAHYVVLPLVAGGAAWLVGWLFGLRGPRQALAP